MGIQFVKVGYTYNPHKKKYKNKYILDNVDLKISNANEMICIVGHTGSGKSTLIQLMNALLIPTVGSVSIDDNIITEKKQKNLKNIRKNVGLVFQFPEYQLFEETVLKDVSFGPKNFCLDDPIKKAKDALDMVKIDESFYDKSPFRLSGGEMRKIAISGILASNPQVLILDEPTVGLDPYAKKELITLLNNINMKYNKTIIVVTHDMDVVYEISKRVIVLNDNKIVYDGDKYNLFKNEAFLEKHSLDLPEIIKIMKVLKEKLNLSDLNIYQDSLEKAYKELKRVMNNE